MNVRVISGRAGIEMNAATIRNIIASDNDTVVFDLSGLNISSAMVSRSALHQLANAGIGVSVALPQGTITLDSNALAQFISIANSSNITFRISEVRLDQMPGFAERLIPGSTVFQPSISVGSRSIRSFEDATVTISLPLNNAMHSAAFGMDALGLVPLNAYHNVATGLLEIETNHLGMIVISPN